MKHFRRVAIVGVGLIGGSIGLALRRRGLIETVVGIGRRQSSLRTARRVGSVTSTTIDLSKGVVGADLVVVCSPVGKIVEHVGEAAKSCPEGTLITDVGSAKQAIVDALDGQLPRGCRFLGSHPLAGSEKTGAANASADLFDGRVVILTPTKNTLAEDFDLLEGFWSALGSVVIQMPADEHDRALALTSHLPHVVAAMLAALVPEPYFRLSSAGLLDTTRIAASDPELWKQILVQNRANVLAALRSLERQLAALRSALEQGDELALQRLLAAGKKARDALGS